eukprot:CAMPEP_0117033520 /NCGR_PEP_ID=MMETSP0472-20121206/23937_1 /TAXON_ID=693140 ORGANISM="Tiarina fusus, Strain LIS" /NCGR_SAMPLE_ID=MMETSP0472 /ASSEMBLY_ACC=CAM_ASM_000603 /LENGTH=221 /DNA_ID=CAMNT_0004742445 /DNA_START=131 /DNA_END=792 /DNA_ORIENTATION=-
MATVIQSAFRTYSTQKKNIIPNLRRLREVETKIQRAGEKFSNLISNNPSLCGEKLRLTYAEYEESLTKGLLELDSIITKGVDVVREIRKNIVVKINAELAKIDSKKEDIRESVRREQLEKEEANNPQSQSDSDYSDCEDSDSSEQPMEIDSEMELEVVNYSDNCESKEAISDDTEFDEKLLELKAEEESLLLEKEKLDKMIACWESRQLKFEKKREAFVSG